MLSPLASPFVPLSTVRSDRANASRTAPDGNLIPRVYTGAFGPVQLVVVWYGAETQATWCDARSGVRLGPARVGAA